MGLVLLGLAFGGGAAGKSLLWAGAALYGLGMASVFPTALVVTESRVAGDLSGRFASVIMVGSATGEMLIPLAVGLLTARWPPWFAFTATLATLAFAAAAVRLCAMAPSSYPRGHAGQIQMKKTPSGVTALHSVVSEFTSREPDNVESGDPHKAMSHADPPGFGYSAVANPLVAAVCDTESETPW